MCNNILSKSDTPYCVAFSHAPGIGPASYSRLLKNFTSPKKAFRANKSQLSKVINAKFLKDFLEFRKHVDPYKIYNKLLNKSVHSLCFGSSNYPKSLCSIKSPPICLYALGDINLLHSKRVPLAMIGTRKPTFYGRSITKDFAHHLAKQNTIILSGLALGIDALAHSATLEVGGKTIAVLGSGITDCYPHQNLRLYKRILNESGLIVSEYPPGTPAFPANFAQRNRIIAGLSKGIIIIEGNSKSGTLITGRYAAEQGKDVFGIPGPLTSPLSKAPHQLIQSGAYLADEPEYISDFYNLQSSKPVSKTTIKLISALSQKPMTASQLSMYLNIPIHKLLNNLTQEEIEGHIQRQPDNFYTVIQ